MSFTDFQLYRLRLESAHFIAGFGRIETLGASDIILTEPNPESLAAAETDILDHMNTDHTDSVLAYANVFADRHGLDWTMSGIDPEGIDLARNDAESRVDFENLVSNPASARAELMRLAKVART